MGRREALCTKANGEPIRILDIGAHFCIRNIKMCRALKKKGYHLDALTGKISYGIDEYEKVFFYNDKHQFKNVLEATKGWYDIIKVANEPDWMLVVASNMGCKNLVHDCHDLDSIRFKHDNITNIDEIRVFNNADGAIFVSKPIEEYAKELHKFDKPTAVFYHYCNDDYLDLYTPGQDLNRSGIVYEGGANPPQVDAHTPFKYRSLYHVFKKVVDMGNEVHMYIGNYDGFEAYQDIGAIIYPPTHYDEMMKGMTLRKWGALIFNNEELTEEQTNITTMNKAYEYIMAGLPLVILGAPLQAELLRKYGVAIELKKISDLGNIEQNYGHLYPELKANVDRVRTLLTTERHIHIIENLYKRVLDNTKHK